MKTDFSDFTIYMIALGTLGAFRWLGEKSLTEALLMAAFFGLLYAAGQIDRKRGRLPDWCMGAAFLLGFCGLPFFDGILLPDRILGSFAVSLPLFVICLIRPGAFGGGDVKLMAGCGFFLGAEAVWLSFLFAIFAAGGQALFLLFTGRAGRKTRFPLGPFLCAGMALVLVFGFP